MLQIRNGDFLNSFDIILFLLLKNYILMQILNYILLQNIFSLWVLFECLISFIKFKEKWIVMMLGWDNTFYFLIRYFWLIPYFLLLKIRHQSYKIIFIKCFSYSASIPLVMPPETISSENYLHKLIQRRHEPFALAHYLGNIRHYENYHLRVLALTDKRCMVFTDSRFGDLRRHWKSVVACANEPLTRKTTCVKVLYRCINCDPRCLKVTMKGNKCHIPPTVLPTRTIYINIIK